MSKIESLNAALEALKALDVSPWDLLAYAMAKDADQDADEARTDDPDTFGPEHDGAAHLEAMLDDSSWETGSELMKNAIRMYRETKGIVS